LPGIEPTDWVEFEILRRELDRSLYDAIFPANPFAR
jgi:hypothetical protein